MTIVYEKLLTLQIEPIVQKVIARDAIIYALGVGAGSVLNEQNEQLKFVYEEQLEFLPTFSTVIAYPGVWIARPDTGIAWKHCLNGEYVVAFHRPPRLNEAIESRIQITEVIDTAMISARGKMRWTSFTSSLTLSMSSKPMNA